MLTKIADVFLVPKPVAAAVGSMLLWIISSSILSTIYHFRYRRAVKWFEGAMAKERQDIQNYKQQIEAGGAQYAREIQAKAARHVAHVEQLAEKSAKDAKARREWARAGAQIISCDSCNARSPGSATFCRRCGATLRGESQ